MPKDTSTVTVDGLTLQMPYLPLAQLVLTNIEYITPATSASNVGIYFIRPGAHMSDTVLIMYIHYTYQDGLLNSENALLIVPKDTNACVWREGFKF